VYSAAMRDMMTPLADPDTNMARFWEVKGMLEWYRASTTDDVTERARVKRIEKHLHELENPIPGGTKNMRELQKVIKGEMEELLEKTKALPFDPDQEREFWQRRYHGMNPWTGRPIT
jgi:hypothetical protein